MIYKILYLRSKFRQTDARIKKLPSALLKNLYTTQFKSVEYEHDCF